MDSVFAGRARAGIVLVLAFTLFASFTAGAAASGPAMDTTSWPAPQADAPPAHDGLHVVVAFERTAHAADRAAAHAVAGATLVNRMEWANAEVVRVASGDDPDDVAARYLRNPKVASAEPNWLLRPASIPNDYFFEYLWNLHNVGQALHGGGEFGTADADIDAPEAWDLAFGTGEFPQTGGVRVGILDGYYEIRPMAAGSYTCTADAYGTYRSKSQHVTVTEGATTTANFVLRKGNG